MKKIADTLSFKAVVSNAIARDCDPVGSFTRMPGGIHNGYWLFITEFPHGPSEEHLVDIQLASQIKGIYRSFTGSFPRGFSETVKL